MQKKVIGYFKGEPVIRGGKVYKKMVKYLQKFCREGMSKRAAQQKLDQDQDRTKSIKL